MNFQSIISQMMKSGNPQGMLQNLIKSNPQMQQAWQIAQTINQKGGNKEDQLKEACAKSGTDFEKVKSSLKQFGISI